MMITLLVIKMLLLVITINNEEYNDDDDKYDNHCNLKDHTDYYDDMRCPPHNMRDAVSSIQMC